MSPFAISQLYVAKCNEARQKSKDEQCTFHVNPLVSITTMSFGPVPHVSGFIISDWYEPNTLASFTDGEQH